MHSETEITLKHGPRNHVRSLLQAASFWKRATPHAAGNGAGGGAPPPHSRAHHELRLTTRGGDSNTYGSVASNSQDVPPALALNPDYEYELPLHLALFAQVPSSLVLTGRTEPGSTVVFAPYTVSPTHPASTSTNASEETRDDGRTAFPGVSLHEASLSRRERKSKPRQ